jgi:hypothetical protein
MLRNFGIAIAAWLLAGPALAGTKAQLNVVPSLPDCFIAGSVCLNNGAGCGFDNSECALSGLSASSKISLTGKLALKGTIKGVKDNSGTLVTTGPEGSSDNFILKLSLNQCLVDTGSPPLCDDGFTVYVKVALSNGTGKINVDLGPVLAGVAVGDPLMLAGGALHSPAGEGSCLGANSTADLAARIDDASCETIGVYGVLGIVREQ